MIKAVASNFFLSACFCLSLGLLALAAGCAGPRDAAPEPRVTQREVEIRLDLAEAYLRNNEPRLALQELNLIKTQAQSLPRYHFTLGFARIMLGQEAQAVSALQRAVDLDPDHGEAWNNLGLALLAVDQVEAAQQAFAAALDIPTYRTPEVAALNLALLLQDTGRLDEALRFATMAVDLNWRFSRAYLLAAEINLARGHTDQAISLLRRGAEANLDDPRILLALVEYLCLAGRADQTLPWLEQLQSTAPESPEARRAEEYRDFLGGWKAAFMGREGVVFEQDIEEDLSPGDPPQLTGPEDARPLPVEPPAGREGPPAALQDGQGRPDERPADRTAPPLDAPRAEYQGGPEHEYIVQVGGFLEQQRALDLCDVLLAEGFTAGTVVVEHKGKTWNLVFIASAQTRDEAQKLAASYKRLTGRDALVVRVGQGRYLD